MSNITNDINSSTNNDENNKLGLEYFEEGGDSDADAFAYIAIIVIIAMTLAYYFNS